MLKNKNIQDQSSNSQYENIISESTIYSIKLIDDFLKNDNLNSKLQQSFGNNSHLVQIILHDTVTNGFESLLSVEDLNGASGAYAESTNSLYLSPEFLEKNFSRPDIVANVLLEEIGHSIDTQVNEFDTPGDEGAVFAANVQGQNLSDSELIIFAEEDDSATLLIDGEKIDVELATPEYPGYIFEYVKNEPVSNGEDDADVELWQQAMLDQGYDIEVDGLYGAESEQVTRQFQQDNGLVVDGLVGPNTWEASFENIQSNHSSSTSNIDKTTDDDKVSVYFDAFIPQDVLDAPFHQRFISDTEFYEGDDRGFEYGGSYRIRQTFVVDLDAENPQPIFLKENVGTTHALDEDRMIVDEGLASTNGLSTDITKEDDLININVEASANNPLVLGSPNIDYSYDLSLSLENGILNYELDGQHDGFPAYSAYIGESRIYGHSPVLEDQGPSSLFGIGKGEFDVNESGSFNLTDVAGEGLGF